MSPFNDLISDLDLVEIPFSGRKFTQSNMQSDPLLVKLDQVFTSSFWTLSYPTTHVQPLSRPISNHIPYVLHIRTKIPKSMIFCFEKYQANHPGFLETEALHWNNSPVFSDAAKNLCSKLKHVRSGLRNQSKKFSNLNKLINNCNWVLLLMDGLEDQRALSRLESAFRDLVKSHLASLLE